MQRKQGQFDFMGFGSLIICFMYMTIVTAVSLFIFGVPMNRFVAPIGMILSGVVYWRLSTYTQKEKTVTLLTALLIVAFCATVVGNVFDYSWDGNSYRKVITGAMTEGWNPVYQFLHTVKDNYITLTGPYPINIMETDEKATWIFASAIHALTGNIEAGKSFTFLSMAACLSIFFSIFKDSFGYSKPRAAMIAVAMQASPVILAQALTYYADAYLANMFFVVAVLLALLMLKKEKQKDRMVWWTLFFAVVIGLTSKVNGLIMMGVPCILFVARWVICRLRDHSVPVKKRAIDSARLIGFFSVMVIMATCFIGTTGYLQNYIKTGNPIYPTDPRGDTPQEQLPGSLVELSHPERFLYSLFSEYDNTRAASGKIPRLKIPFTFELNDLNVNPIDTRSGGWGILFSGAFTLGVLVIVICCIKAYKRKEFSLAATLLLLSVSVIGPSLVFPGMWWARYNMGIVIIPVMALAILLRSPEVRPKKGLFGVSNILAGVIIFSLLFSCIPALKWNVRTVYNSQITRSELYAMRRQLGKDEVAKVWFVNTFDGLQFNLKDRGIRYEQVKEKPADSTVIYNGFIAWSKGGRQ